MQRRTLTFSLLSLIGLSAVNAGSTRSEPYRVHPYKVELEQEIPRMLDLISNTHLPERPEYPGVENSLGMDLGVLKSLQHEWLHEYSWQQDQSYINK